MSSQDISPTRFTQEIGRSGEEIYSKWYQADFLAFNDKLPTMDVRNGEFACWEHRCKSYSIGVAPDPPWPIPMSEKRAKKEAFEDGWYRSCAF
jgi:hypothetical protein